MRGAGSLVLLVFVLLAAGVGGWFLLDRGEEAPEDEAAPPVERENPAPAEGAPREVARPPSPPPSPAVAEEDSPIVAVLKPGERIPPADLERIAAHPPLHLPAGTGLVRGGEVLALLEQARLVRVRAVSERVLLLFRESPLQDVSRDKEIPLNALDPLFTASGLQARLMRPGLYLLFDEVDRDPGPEGDPVVR